MDDLQRIIMKLENLGRGEFIEKGLTKTGLRIESDAKQNLTDNGNVDTGTLRGSINSEVEQTGLNEWECNVGSNVLYAPFVEYSTGIYAEKGDGRQTPWKYQTPDGQWHTTKGMKTKPYLRPAFAQHKDKAVEDIAFALREEWR